MKDINNLKDFIIDIGDTLGGILLGLSLDAGSHGMMVVGALLIIATIYLKYFKTRGTASGKNNYTIKEIVEHIELLKQEKL
jgi:hypothetical protein